MKVENTKNNKKKYNAKIQKYKKSTTQKYKKILMNTQRIYETESSWISEIGITL